MNSKILNENFQYALYTFQTGLRPFDGVTLILENAIDNFERLATYADGIESSTRDVVARSAISDTALVMGYSLLEGFFFEECDFWLNKKFSNPVGAINALTMHHGIVISEWKIRRKKINIVRELRNCVVHQNGNLPKDFDKSEISKIFGENLFEATLYPRMSLAMSLRLLGEFREIAREYAGLVLDKQSIK